jgi:signal peptidase I
VLSVQFVLPLFFVEPFVIPTGAMEDTILIGDHIVFQTVPRFIPARGDIVAFIYPVDRRQTFVKRIAGVPGNRIRFSGKALYRNEVRADEPYAVHKTDYIDSFRDNFPADPNTPLSAQAQDMLLHNVVNGAVVVPPGKYFLLGNRDESLDSRYWGFVSAGDFIGKPLFIYYLVDQSIERLSRGLQFGWQRNVRWNRIFKPL